MMNLITLGMLDKFRDLALLLMRAGLGISFVFHGWPKISNPEKWEQLGGAMGNLGIHFLPAFWGFMAAFAEFGGGILLALGLFARPAAGMMWFTMVVACLMHIKAGDGFKDWSHSLEVGFAFLGLLFVGPRKFSLDNFLNKDKKAMER